MALLDDLKKIRELLQNPTIRRIAKKEGGKAIAKVAKRETEKLGRKATSAFTALDPISTGLGAALSAAREAPKAQEPVSSNLLFRGQAQKEAARAAFAPQFAKRFASTVGAGLRGERDVGVGTELSKTLGLTGIPAFGVGLAAELAVPGPAGEIKAAKKFDTAIRATSKANKTRDLAKTAMSARSQFIDKFAPIEVLTRKARKSGELAAEKDPFILARTFAGVGDKIDMKLNQELSPILKSVGDNVDDFSKFLVAERIQELSKRGITKFPGGLTPKDASDEITRISSKLGPEGFSNLQNAGNNYRNFMNQFLDNIREAGIISEEGFKNIKSRNEAYTPFAVAEYLQDNIDDIPRGARSLSVASQNVIKELKGSTKDIVDPIEASIRQVAKSMTLVERNKAARSLADLSKIDDFKDTVRLAGKGDGVGKDFGKVSFFEDGVKKDLIVPKDVAESMKGLNQQNTDLMTRMARWQTGLLRTGATTFNVGFLIPNIIRDVRNAKVISQNGLTLGSWFEGLASALKKDDVYKEWVQSGGSGGTLSTIAKGGTARAKARLAGTRGIVSRVASSPIDLMRELGRVSEEGTRVGVFKQASKKGASPLEAAFQSREGTVDFAKSGTVTKIANMWVPFLNARLQGTVNIINSMKRSPGKTSLRLASVVGVPTVATYLWNRRFQDFKDIPDFEKDNNFIIITRDRTPEEKEAGEKVKGVKIPKADVDRLFGNTIEKFMSFADSKDPQSLDNLALDVIGELSPVGATSQEISSATLPPIAKAGVETLSNVNMFTGMDIEPSFQDGVRRQDIPEGLRARTTTGKTARAIGGVTGGVGVSPADVENIAGTLLGGLGRQALQLGDLALGGQPFKGPSDVPVLRRFTGIRGGAERSEAFDEADRIAQELGAKKVQDNETARKVFEVVSKTDDEGEQIKLIQQLKTEGVINENVEKRLDSLIKKSERGDLGSILARLQSTEAKATYIRGEIERGNANIMDELEQRDLLTKGLASELAIQTGNIEEGLDGLKTTTGAVGSEAAAFLVDALDAGSLSSQKYDEIVSGLISAQGSMTTSASNILVGSRVLEQASRDPKQAGALVGQYTDKFLRTSTGQVGVDAFEFVENAFKENIITEQEYRNYLASRKLTPSVKKRISQ